MRLHRFRLLVLAFASLLGYAAASSATANEADAGVPTQAVWRIQEFNFNFRAQAGRYYSCAMLRQKISGIMEAMGAGSVIVTLACPPNALVDRVSAHIATATPMPATPENVQAATTFDTERQLLARVRNTPLPTPETIERFPAEWREIAVTKVDGVHLGPEDCELLEDIHKQILPQMPSIRVVRARFACGGTQLRAARPILVIEALVRRQA